jgi:MFS family permease
MDLVTDVAVAAQPTEPTQGEAAGRWRALGQLALAMVLAMTTWFSAAAVLPQLRDDWQLSSTQASLLTIAVQIGFVVGAVASATLNLADLVSPRRLVLVGAAGAAASNLLLIWADGAGLALPLRFLTGAFLAAVYPPSLKAMSTWFRGGRGTALGVMVGALTLGSALPHLVNGFGGIRWQLVIVISSVLTLLGGLVAEYWASDGPFAFPKATFNPRQIGRTFTNRGIRLANIGYFGHMWELYAMWTWIAVFYGDQLSDRGVGNASRLAALAAFGAIGVGAVGCYVGGVLGDRWGRTRFTALAMLLSGTGAIAVGLARHTHPVVILVIALIWGFWVIADSAQFSTMVTELADQSYVGTAVTLQLAVGFTLTVLTIWLVPVLRDSLTWTWAFAFLAPGPAMGTLAMLRLMRSPEAAQIAGGRG